MRGTVPVKIFHPTYTRQLKITQRRGEERTLSVVLVSSEISAFSAFSA